MSDSPAEFADIRAADQPTRTSAEGLLPQLVQHLRKNRTVLREEWAR
ncbi:MAG: STAS domain-containing protein, partial [Mycobacterium sp.]